MQIFVRKHIEGFLIGSAVLLVGVLLWCFFWSMSYVSQSLDSVFETKSAGTQTVSFDLSGAQKLNLRGMAPQ
jgi:hypothetical protein